MPGVRNRMSRNWNLHLVRTFYVTNSSNELTVLTLLLNAAAIAVFQEVVGGKKTLKQK